MNKLEPMNNLMIDIETLGNRSDAIVVAIGAQLFDPITGELGDSFYTALNYQDQINKGRKITESTIAWWMEQDKAAQKVFFEEAIPTELALSTFFDFCKDVKGLKPWGNGPSFDLTIMETLFRDFGYDDLPWNFWNVKCLRTFKDFIYDGKDLNREGVYHHALDDCKHQIKIVSTGLLMGEKDYND